MSALWVFLHDLLVALKLGCNDLVPGDGHVMVDIGWMLLLGFIDLQAGLCHKLQERAEKVEIFSFLMLTK